MTNGAIEIGGLPLPQERANPHRNKQISRERALFNPGHQYPHGPKAGRKGEQRDNLGYTELAAIALGDMKTFDSAKTRADKAK